MLYGVKNDKDEFECVLFTQRESAELWANRGWRRIKNIATQISPNSLNITSADTAIEMKVVELKEPK